MSTHTFPARVTDVKYLSGIDKFLIKAESEGDESVSVHWKYKRTEGESHPQAGSVVEVTVKDDVLAQCLVMSEGDQGAVCQRMAPHDGLPHLASYGLPYVLSSQWEWTDVPTNAPAPIIYAADNPATSGDLTVKRHIVADGTSIHPLYQG